MASSINAFPDGKSYVAYNKHQNTCLVANPLGLIKIFTLDTQNSEPKSIDINENLTNFSTTGELGVITATSGNLELISLSTLESSGNIFRSELPLRDARLINENKRVVAGGDEPQLVIIDLETEPKTSTTFALPNSVLNISYNATGEMIAVSLSDQSVQIFSVINEKPSLLETLSNCIPEKIFTSLDGELTEDELVCSKTEWSPNGEFLFVPNNKSINVISRSNFKQIAYTIGELESKLLDFNISSDGKYISMLTKDSVKVYSISSKQEKLMQTLTNPTNISWGSDNIFIGSSTGEYLTLSNLESLSNGDILDMESDQENNDKMGSNYLFDEAEEGNIDDLDNTPVHEEDANIIDEDDNDAEIDAYLASRKRQRSSKYLSSEESSIVPSKIAPFSQGATPWSDNTTQSRRYLFMNTIGYIWAVKSENQSITVSFFDRAKNKDYHFTDFHHYDVCSMNENGLLLGCSGYQSSEENKGRLFYRNHDSLQDSWDIKIPLAKGEYITAISLTSDTSELIVVGTSFGYMRFFNSCGVCIFLMKTSPVVAMMSSGSTVFVVNQPNISIYTYSLINVDEDYKFIQHDCMLNLQTTIKGLFFNERRDPCIVTGVEDSLLILSNWREPGNAKWIPLIHLKNEITEDGNNEVKKNWHAWPLGLYRDEVSILILKSGSKYPGFPLPLPVDITIKLPIGASNEEEEFLRALTMGRIVNASLADFEEDEEEIIERLEQYSVAFDRSLLKMFAQSCQDGQIVKAFSIAKLIKTDKALSAASKIAERMEFMSLANRIAKLREALMED